MSKEYIAREALKAEFIGNPQDNYTPNLIKAIIDSQPAADVAEVVTCENCKYHFDDGAHRCMKLDFLPPTSDFYCKYGRRRTNE